MFDAIKGVMTSRRSKKDIQHNTKKRTKANNDLLNITQNTKD
jgi:hypothetical protein